MKVYIVVFEGAYGMQICEVFTSYQKAVEYKEQKQKSDSYYNYEILEFFAI